MGNESPLKLMYLNPVGTPDYDEVFADMARTVKLPGTEVHVTSLKPAAGAFTHIEYRSYEAVVSTGIVRAARAAAAERFDALAIGCFYDSALHEAREVSADMVVTAPCAPRWRSPPTGSSATATCSATGSWSAPSRQYTCGASAEERPYAAGAVELIAMTRPTS